ncbi:MBL fold metallo-hydrolase [Synechocystis sp. PCC 7339]|uniref:MBL fold metallo-hydrolase n=1 Tax=unclassified Synechocystis TaxID=2640012 RepID=UPI001BB04F00|nr:MULTISPECIES: MBL fold metallo-hydrolase [unclassified Synechocystis]QUS61092.1 MBL fold metallo-hydrolase [Synechocystis sp. PCC 7338]UAJ73275.1 MBL fold metallo-hydrolase [Synechocystis sp. PCC 7339]
MLFRQLFDPETSTYTYVVADPRGRSAALVDSVLEQVDRDLRLLKELDLKLIFCLETHVHADHITGAGKLRQLTGCQNLVPQYADVDCADRHLQDGEMIHVGSIPILAIATPGHTDSHLAFLVNQTHVLTGDVLLIRGCGRTDFQSGDASTLYDSIHNKLFTLPDEVLVYPGHDYRGHTVSTMGEEKRFNPRFLGRDRQEFIEFMNSLNLPDPKKIMEAVPANQLCGQKTVAL